MADEKRFSCAIVTPEAQVFEGDVRFAALPAHDGEIGILRDRAPLLCKLGIGVLRVERDGREMRWFVDGGFAQMIGNRLTVLTRGAMSPDGLDPAAAQAKLADALKMPSQDEQSRKARAEAVARAKAQIRMATSR